MTKGHFITFEGIDGAGKSTQLVHAAKFLENRGIPVLQTREPGGTLIGEQLRHLLLDEKSEVHPDTELLMIFAARNEHIEQVIKPTIESGTTVICDRFTDATFAYQGGGSRINNARIETIASWVQGSFQPDLTLYFDLPIPVAQRRMGNREKDRFEAEQYAFHERVRKTYLKRVERAPDRMRLIDSRQNRSKVRMSIESILSDLCS